MEINDMSLEFQKLQAAKEAANNSLKIAIELQREQENINIYDRIKIGGYSDSEQY